MTLRRAIADHLEEKGDAVAAEAVKWTIDKNRKCGDHWYTNWAVHNSQDIPIVMHDKCLCPDICSKNKGSSLNALNRLVAYYRKLTPEELVIVWNWTPKGAAV